MPAHESIRRYGRRAATGLPRTGTPARRRLPALLAAAAAVLLASALSAHAQPAWKPTRNIEVIVGASPGGGADATARMIQRLLQEKLVPDVPASVVNRTGGGSSLSYVYLNQRPGDAHYVALSLQPMLTGPIMGTGAVRHTDMTPLAHLFNEYVGFAVRPDSSIASGRDLVARLRKDPASATITLSTALGGSNHLATSLALRAAAVELKRLRIIVVPGATETVTNVLGGHVDVVASSVSSLIPFVKSGKLRGIAVSGGNRVAEIADVPTWKELGVASTYANWRGVMGPRGLTAAQIAFWDDVLARLVQLPEWKEDLAKRGQDPAYLGSRETKRYIDAQYEEFRALLAELGLAK